MSTLITWVTKCSPRWRTGSLRSTSLRVGHLPQLSGIFLEERFVCFCLFVYPLFDHLLISVWVLHIYLILWAIICHYFTFLLKLFPIRQLGAPSFGSCLSHASITVGVVSFFHQFLTFRLICVFPTRVLGSAISPRSPGSSHWRVVLEAKTWTLDVLVVTGLSLLLGPLSLQG